MKKRRMYLMSALTSVFLSGCIFLPPPVTGEDLTYARMKKEAGYVSGMPSSGDVKALVIPVEFTDAPAAGLPKGEEGTRLDIQKAFFGTGDDLPWYSVAGFYDLSSYGKLHLTGVVRSWFTASITATGLAGKDTNAIKEKIIKPAITHIKDTEGAEYLKQFDSDADGYIDSLHFIYSVKARPEGEGWPEDTSLFWAFTAYNGGISATFDAPGTYSYVWASYDFMYKDGVIERTEDGKPVYDENNEPVFHPYTDGSDEMTVDAHTYIHETGHLMGLPDYYTYDEDIGDWGASGTLDMMDYNVGDHNAYSKAALGWIEPTVVSDSSLITLKSFTETGQSVILSADYKGTIIDEYLVLEFYTPTGLNERDSVMPFAGRYPKTFSGSGLKVYHVDSRMGRWKYVGGDVNYQFDGYTGEIRKPYNGYYGIANSNTASRSGYSEHKLLHLLEKDGGNSFLHGYFATDRTLWREGHSFGYSSFTGFTLNSGLKLNFRFRVVDLDEDEIRIQVVRFA